MLVLEEKNGRVPRQEIKGGEVTLGRRPDNTICLEAEVFSMVSGLHAHISETSDGWVLEDDNSTNGTFLNGTRLTRGERATLKAGDRIQLANHGPLFTVYIAGPPSPAPEVTLTFRLRVLTGGKRGAIIVLPQGTSIIGTGTNADIRFDPFLDASVALEHVALRTTGRSLEAKDLTDGSGLLVNGRKVQVATLNHRDRILVGLNGPEIELEVLSLPKEQATALEVPAQSGTLAPLKVSMSVGAGARSSSTRQPRSFLQALVAEYEDEKQRNSQGVEDDDSRDRPAPDSRVIGATEREVRQAQQGDNDVVRGGTSPVPPSEDARRSGGTGGSTQSDENAESPPGLKRRRLWVQVAILLVLLVLTCVVSILVALTLKRRSEPTLVNVTGHTDIVSLADSGPDTPPSGEQQFANDLDALLKQLQVQHREVKAETRQDLLRYLEQTRSARPGRRVSHYLPEIIEILNDADLPLPLMYLPWIESRFDPAAVSPAGATGLWQFMGRTARRYGLEPTIHADDQRKDWVHETRIAALYLKDLMHFDHPEWDPLLAIAAYNRGEEGIVADLADLARRRHGLRTLEDRDESLFWALREEGLIPDETAEYVPRYLGATVYFVFLEHYI